MKYPEQVNAQRQKVDQWLYQYGGKLGVTANGYRVSLGGVEKDLELDGGNGCTTLWIF